MGWFGGRFRLAKGRLVRVVLREPRGETPPATLLTVAGDSKQLLGDEVMPLVKRLLGGQGLEDFAAKDSGDAD